MQFLFNQIVKVNRYSTTLGEYNRPQKTLTEVGTYECLLTDTNSNTTQRNTQKQNSTDLRLYTEPEADIKLGDILYIYEKDEYDKPIEATKWKSIADKPYKKRTHLSVPLLSEEEV